MATQVKMPLFRGYAACPLNRVYMRPASRDDLKMVQQLRAVGDREGFQVVAHLADQVLTNHATPTRPRFHEAVWAQDHQFVQRTAKGLVLRLLGAVYPSEISYVQDLGKKLGLPVKPMQAALEGGNFFIGKRPDGKPYALVGQDSLLKTAQWICFQEHQVKQLYLDDIDLHDVQARMRYVRASNQFNRNRADYMQKAEALIAQELKAGLPKTTRNDLQVTYLSQPDFHIDLHVRPLSGNTVLLNDAQLSLDLLNQASQKTRSKAVRQELEYLRRSLSNYQQYQRRNRYANVDQLEKELQQAGFKVIRIPGVFRSRDAENSPVSKANRSTIFTNALVHQRENGKLVFITNQSYLPILNRLFEKTLKAKAPQIARVDFIGGKTTRLELNSNLTTNTISSYLDLGGGIHCLSTEEPDFDRWA